MWASSAGRRVWTSVAIIVVGIALFVWAIQTLRRAGTGVMLHRSTSAIVESGPYGWSRNPQYVACALLICGGACLANSLWPIVLLPLVLAVVHYGTVRPEESYMIRKFGARYVDYQRRVRRWL